MAKPYRRRIISTVGRAYSLDPFERIASIGGVNSDHTRWNYSQPAAIALIENGADEFVYQVGDQQLRVVVLNHDGEKYLQSERERTHPDDLLTVTTAMPTMPQPVARTATARRR